MDLFATLPDDLLLAVLSRVGSAASDVSRAAMTCRRWNAAVRHVPALCLGPNTDGAAANQTPYLTFERQVSRMILRTRALRHLTIISPPAFASYAPLASSHDPPSANCDSPSGPCHGRASGRGSSSLADLALERDGSRLGASRRRPFTPCSHCCSLRCSCSRHCAGCASAPLPHPRHPREFIFDAWMRHVGPSLRSLTLSRALPAPRGKSLFGDVENGEPASSGDGNGSCASGASASASGSSGGGSVVVNLWEEEDASLHLAHVSRHCTSLRSLSLGHVSLSAPTLLAALQPMPALQHLSLSWLHASPAALHAVLDAAPNLRSLTIFMASGFPYLELQLPPALEHISLSYIRADSVEIRSAHSLQSLSLRDMFLRALSVRDALNLRQLAVASANCLLVSAPHSTRLAQIDLRAGSLNWPATETLISTSSLSLQSLSMDFFTSRIGEELSRVFSLAWLAKTCPGLMALKLGALAWQHVVCWAKKSGVLQGIGAEGPAYSEYAPGRDPSGRWREQQVITKSAAYMNGGVSSDLGCFSERDPDESACSGYKGMPWVAGSTVNSTVCCYSDCDCMVWPKLRKLTVTVVQDQPEGVLLLHTMLREVRTLESVEVGLQEDGEDDDDEDEENEEGEEEEEQDGGGRSSVQCGNMDVCGNKVEEDGDEGRDACYGESTTCTSHCLTCSTVEGQAVGVELVDFWTD
ncbi:hypothetical protein CLOM_g21620 [Closterium sp. NIES-68]|nr:hypothetical protein CLOM_g21620 [Closterium sp. NIES-68]GJP72934.1 hypothetical protein CLOP_g3702 [Closterium sp. NIES-67]